jgi:hypothetical protein
VSPVRYELGFYTAEDDILHVRFLRISSAPLAAATSDVSVPRPNAPLNATLCENALSVVLTPPSKPPVCEERDVGGGGANDA